ncbi:hypothetical protein CHL76_02135 [Marinococcus halophilus]|uniref:Uncharacterized protein n=1 Tax=Marinococcus halophilus TaxID=1371 RepID=A0A510Y1C4_MARHA|nr:hypothetical protein [Marinococcus halophilus]OZT81176.1 hypothetical protein CHL76_02135 [Marinococcus halophilus]GEK57106.1 hypothetical protein MHA01_00110 [Marinococcus halophilus]
MADAHCRASDLRFLGLEGCGRTISGEHVLISLSGSTTDVSGNVASYDVEAALYRKTHYGSTNLITIKTGWVSGYSPFNRDIYGVHTGEGDIFVKYTIFHSGTDTVVDTIYTHQWTH